MSNRNSYHFLATVLLVLLLAITMAVSPTAGKRCAHPSGRAKNGGCQAGYVCVNTKYLPAPDKQGNPKRGNGRRPRCKKINDDCSCPYDYKCPSGSMCPSGWVCASNQGYNGCYPLA